MLIGIEPALARNEIAYLHQSQGVVDVRENVMPGERKRHPRESERDQRPDEDDLGIEAQVRKA